MNLIFNSNNLDFTEQLNKQTKIQNNLKGSLDDSTLKYESIYLHYILNIIVIITIICIIVYFLFNRQDNAFSSGVALILVFILIYIISKYIYDYFI